MRRYAIKYRKWGAATLFVFLTILCGMAVAGDDIGAASSDETDTPTTEVLTTLEQRMQKNISVDFRDTPVADVIRLMADQTGVNYYMSPKVVGNVTATLSEVTLEEALNNILAAHGFDYVADENMIRIGVAEEFTEAAERLVSKIYRVTYADVGEVEEALNKFISKRGSLSTNASTSNIIVIDTESKMKAIDTFINEIDRVTPQILVEARIYDITSQDKLDIGVEWNAGRKVTYGTSGVGTVGTDPSGEIDPFLTGVFTGATGKTSGTTGLLRIGWLKSVDIDAVIRAQQNIINAKLLANPRVLVLDNKEASIDITSERPYQELTESSEGGSIGSTSFKKVGVKLTVTPHVTRDEMVRLILQPEFSTHQSDVTFKSGSLEYPQPIVDTRKADTTLLVKNGQTVVLGGLRKKEVRQQINKVPLLGDVPLLGNLFKFKGEDTVISELVVFVTPWIVENPEMSQTEVEQFEVTNFEGPKPMLSSVEKRITKKTEN